MIELELPFVSPSGYDPHRTSQRRIVCNHVLSNIPLEGALLEDDRTHMNYPAEPSSYNQQLQSLLMSEPSPHFYKVPSRPKPVPGTLVR